MRSCTLTASGTFRKTLYGLFNLTWPAPGKGLLPGSLRGAWGAEPLPGWLAEQCGLAPDTKLGALDSHLSSQMPVVPEALLRYLVRLVRSRQWEIADMAVVANRWHRDLNPKSLGWDTRTWNCLFKVGLLLDPDRLSRVTFRDLFRIPSMGAKSILDFAVNLEAAIPRGSSEDANGGQPQSATTPTGVDTNVLLEIIHAPWTDMISEEDPRFSDLLPAGRGTLLQRIDSLTAASPGMADDKQVAELARAIPAVKERVNESDTLALDVAMRHYVSALSRATGVRLEALLARIGWGARPPVTLQEAAERAGLTREAIRQIQKRVEDRVPSHAVYMPALDRALDYLAAAAPLPADEAAKRLAHEGICTMPFHPANVLAAAQLCSRVASFQLQEIKGRPCVVTSATLASSGRVLTVATRRASAAGATNVEDVVAAVAGEGIEITAPDVRDLLLPLAGAEFLESDWFWMPRVRADRNRLYNVAKAILSVVSPVDVTTIRDGARRKYRLLKAGIVPPRAVMAAFFKAHPAFQVDAGGLVGPVDLLDYRQELGAAEQTIVEVLRASPTGILDRAGLGRACETRGLNPSTLGVMTSYSPILEHLGTDMWSLRGTRVDPAAVQAFREANALRPREKRIADHGWNPAGDLWLAIRVPRSPVGTIGMPATVAPYLAGRRFTARTDDGLRAGIVVVTEEGASWGYAPFLNRAGADEGDILLATFDLTTNEVVLAIASNEAMEEIAG